MTIKVQMWAANLPVIIEYQDNADRPDFAITVLAADKQWGNLPGRAAVWSYVELGREGEPPPGMAHLPKNWVVV